jgi:hypothetical protein
MVAAERLKDATPPVDLLLAAPLFMPRLATIHEQVAAQYAIAVKAKVLTQQQAEDRMAELDRIIAQVIIGYRTRNNEPAIRVAFHFTEP